MSNFKRNPRRISNTRKRRYGQNRSSSRRSKRIPNNKKSINPALFVKEAKPQTNAEYINKFSFEQFEIHTNIKSNIKLLGFSRPTQIQDQAIPYGLQGKDVVGIANTGTGKTMAFSIPVLNSLLDNSRSQAVILAPTRELAEQIDLEIQKLANNMNINTALLIGGRPIYQQEKKLRKNPRIIVGTPGRIKDHQKRRSLNLAKVELVVLDEVDRMLDMGFIDDIRRILSQVTKKKQSYFFSATMDPNVRKIISDFSHDPKYIEVESRSGSENVAQDVISYNERIDKIDKLHNLLISDQVEKAIIFEETKRGVDRLHKVLQNRGFGAELMHGGKSQGHRRRALKRFKDNDVKFMIATDVAARGIDVSDISHVINYSTPNSYEDYIHRIGRAGRAGKAGSALTFVKK